MKLKLLNVCGFNEAMLGVMLSKGKTSFDIMETYANTSEIKDDIFNRFNDLSENLSRAGSGHDKFMEQIQYWIAVQAPLYWWKQFDTYRHTSKSSESTMYGSWKHGVTNENFANPDLVYQSTIDRLNKDINVFNNKDLSKCDRDVAFKSIITNLPDSYLQTRMVNLNAKTLKNIYHQRLNHKLGDWAVFLDFIESLPYAKLIINHANIC